MTKELARVRAARRDLERVRGRLLRPSLDSLDACADGLNAAIASLAELQRDLRSPERNRAAQQELASEIQTMRREARQAEEMLHAAGRFFAGWARLIACGGDSAAANYSAHGRQDSPVPIDRGQVVAHG